MHSRQGLLFGFVPITEAGAPIPDGPAEFLVFGGAAKGGVKVGARDRVGFGVAAEFTEVDGAAIVI